MRILKWAVPIDDGWHRIGPGLVVLVDAGPDPDPGTAWVWTMEPDEGQTSAASPVEARVYGTGQSFDRGYWHLGSYVDARYGLVWHVLGRRVRSTVEKAAAAAEEARQ